jgi:hypothetical protein
LRGSGPADADFVGALDDGVSDDAVVAKRRMDEGDGGQETK